MREIYNRSITKLWIQAITHYSNWLSMERKSVTKAQLTQRSNFRHAWEDPSLSVVRITCDLFLNGGTVTWVHLLMSQLQNSRCIIHCVIDFGLSCEVNDQKWMCVNVCAFGFDSLVLARLGRNYLFTSAELKGLIHISYRNLQTILFLKLEHTVGDSCLLKWRKCVLWYILLFSC